MDTAIYQIVQIGRTLFSNWLKMVYGELATNVSFAYAAKLACEIGALPNLLSSNSGNGHTNCGT